MTYDGYMAAWPSRRGEYADKINGMPKYVVSSTRSGQAVDMRLVDSRAVGDGVAILVYEPARD